MLHRTLLLPPRTTSPGRARRFVEGSLEGVELQEAATTAALLVSELVTNAVLHAGTGVEVEVRVQQRRVRIGVSDGAGVRERPHTRPQPGMTTVGRGTQLLEELAHGWGTESRTGGGKTVWFELCDDGRPQTAGSVESSTVGAAASGLARDGARVEVELVDMPVPAARRALDHHDELLRELALVSLNGGGAPRLSDRLLVLAERVRTQFAPLLRPLRQELVVAAARGDRDCRLTVTLPAELRAATVDFAALHAEAEGLARQGHLLTLVPDHEAACLRSWILGQLASQIGGAAPVAYQVATGMAR